VGGEEFRRLVCRADDIVTELRASLDHDPNPRLSEDLEALYIFINGELGKAIIEKDAEPLKNAIRILSTLLDGWTLAQKQLQAGA